MPEKKVPKKPPTKSSPLHYQDDPLLVDVKEPQQAVIIADSFNERFMPITRDKPRCLLPLVNTPALEYTLEFLSLNGIEECIIFCVSHAELIKEYIMEKSRWSEQRAGTVGDAMLVSIHKGSPECSSIGDALRELDAAGVITDDFVLLYGDVVSNMDLSRAIQHHRERRQKDKNMIMTMVLKELSPHHRTREQGESAVFVLDDESGDCLVYDSIEEDKKRTLRFEPSILDQHAHLAIRYDLMDCQIDICAPNILALFTENFDYQELRRDLLRGILNSFDILGYRIGTYVLHHQEYAARVRSSRLYDSVSRDIIGRWAFPIVPETNITGSDTLTYTRKGGHVYMGKDVVLSRTAYIGPGTVLGSGTTVGENSRIIASVLGPNCRIGDNVIIEGAYLWTGVCVHTNSVIRSSILSEGVRVREGSCIAPGCLISSNVLLGPHANLPPKTRITRWSEHIEMAMSSLHLPSTDILAGISADSSTVGGLGESPVERILNRGVSNPLQVVGAAVLGSASDGIIWREETLKEGDECGDDDDDDEADRVESTESALIRHVEDEAFTIGFGLPKRGDEIVEAAWDDYDSQTEDFEDDETTTSSEDSIFLEETLTHAEELDSEYGMSTSCAYSSSTSGSSSDTGFYREATDLLQHSLTLTSTTTVSKIDNCHLEMCSLKLAWNATFADCRYAITSVLVNMCSGSVPQLKASWSQWSPLLKMFMQEGDAKDQFNLLSDLVHRLNKLAKKQHLHDSTTKSSDDRSTTVGSLAENAFALIVTILYKEDAIEEEAIREWYEQATDLVYKQQIKPLLDWLEAQEDEDSEELSTIDEQRG